MGGVSRHYAPKGYPSCIGSDRKRNEPIGRNALYRVLGKKTVIDLIETLSGYDRNGKPIFAPNLPEGMRREMRQVLTEGLNKQENHKANLKRTRERNTDCVPGNPVADTSCKVDACFQRRLSVLMLIYDVTTFEELCKETGTGSLAELETLFSEQEL